MDMSFYLDGVLMPNPSLFRKLEEPNESDNITAGGRLYTDFINMRRTWIMKYERMTKENFDILYNVYRQQYSLKRYCSFVFDAYNISTTAKVNISEQEIRYNGSIVENVNLIIKEEYAFS